MPVQPSPAPLSRPLALRSMHREDVPRVAAVWRATFPLAEQTSIRRQRLRVTYPRLRDNLPVTAQPGWLLRAEHLADTGLVAETGGEVVGFALGAADHWPIRAALARRNVGTVGNLWVQADLQRRGIATQLLLEQFKRLASAGLRYALATLEPDQPAHAALARQQRFEPLADRLVLACPAKVLMDRLGPIRPGVVVSGRETILAMVVRRLAELLAEKPAACRHVAVLKALHARAGLAPLAPDEETERLRELARLMLAWPDLLVASHDASHLCLLFDDALYVSDQFPTDMAEACLRRYAASVLKVAGDQMVRFALAPSDTYALSLLGGVGFVHVGREADVLAELPTR